MDRPPPNRKALSAARSASTRLRAIGLIAAITSPLDFFRMALGAAASYRGTAPRKGLGAKKSAKDRGVHMGSCRVTKFLNGGYRE